MGKKISKVSYLLTAGFLAFKLQQMIWKNATQDDGRGDLKRTIEIHYDVTTLRPYTRSEIPDGIKVLMSTCVRS